MTNLEHADLATDAWYTVYKDTRNAPLQSLILAQTFYLQDIAKSLRTLVEQGKAK